MEKILILGKGYIGQNIFDFLKNKNDFSIEIKNKNELDYTDFHTLDNYIFHFKNNGLKYIINCSGYTGRPNVDGCENDKQTCWRYNVNLPILLTKIAEHWDIPIIHIGSGCVYSGYKKQFTEEDEPNFGIYNTSSFYSKTKHACEISLKNTNSYIFRIRMPFSEKASNRNYLNKLLLYDNLISHKNSLTCVEDLNEFIYKFISSKNTHEYGIYNVVNSGHATGEEIVNLLKKYNIQNKRWRFLDQKDIGFKTPRSNCILSTDKIQKLNLELPNVFESLEKSIKNLKNNI
jgi:dTDP-4-dehydrorhamnose reductase